MGVLRLAHLPVLLKNDVGYNCWKTQTVRGRAERSGSRKSNLECWTLSWSFLYCREGRPDSEHRWLSIGTACMPLNGELDIDAGL
jgi:hypothetical protein